MKDEGFKAEYEKLKPLYGKILEDINKEAKWYMDIWGGHYE